MKNSVYLIILLAAGLALVSYKWIATDYGNPSEGENSQSGNAIETIMTRASVRSYTEEPVSRQQVDTLLHAAMAAPTAVNKQPWRFVVIDNRKTLDLIADSIGSMTMMKEAPLAIVVCGDMESALDGEARDYWVQDTSAATENLLLAAHAMNLGAVWCGVYPKSDRVKLFTELLSLPENIVPLCCIAVGHPKGETEPKDKWAPEKVHYNNWGNCLYK